jgi:hypothetical protein
MEINGIAHLQLTVNDLQRAMPFYVVAEKHRRKGVGRAQCAPRWGTIRASRGYCEQRERG